MRELLGGRDDDRLDLRRDTAVGIGDSALVLEVEHIAHAAHYVLDTELTAGVDGQAVVLDNPDTVKSGDSLPDDIHPLVHVEEPALILVDTNGHDHLVEHGQGAFQDIEMSCGKGIERSREECSLFHNCQSMGVLP